MKKNKLFILLSLTGILSNLFPHHVQAQEQVVSDGLVEEVKIEDYHSVGIESESSIALSF